MLIHRFQDRRSRAKARRRLALKKKAEKLAALQASQRRANRQRTTQPLIYPQRVMVAALCLVAGSTLTTALLNTPLFDGVLSQRGGWGVGGETLLPDRYVDGILPSSNPANVTVGSITNGSTGSNVTSPQADVSLAKTTATASTPSATATSTAAIPENQTGDKPSNKLSRAASPRFSVPRSMSPGTVIWVDGDSSLVRLSQLMRYEFKHRYPGTDVQVAANGSQVALRGVLDGSIDVAAIGRPLTKAEEAQGLVAVPMARHKIAVLIGTDNPFSGSLTNYQFAAILRGEVTNWADVGGPDLPLRLIDRAKGSDTRQALLSYPIFSDVAEKMPSGVARLPGDRLSQITQNLGLEGITYALIDQVTDDVTTPNVVNRDNVKIVPLHQVLPDDPRYSISQPMVYVYHGEKPTPEAKALLGYATVLRRRGLLADGASLNARRAWFETQTFAWSILLLMGAGAWGFTRLQNPNLGQWAAWRSWRASHNRSASDLEGAEFYDEKASNYLILDGMSGTPLGARWQLLPEKMQQLQAQGGKLLHLRLYEFRPGESGEAEANYRRRPFRQYSCPDAEQNMSLVVARRNHRYLAEIGYLTADDRWLRLVTSTVVAAEAAPTTFLEKISSLRETATHHEESQADPTLVASKTKVPEALPAAPVHPIPASGSVQMG